MKRFLLPAGFAVVLHGLLFSMETDWLKRKANSRFKPQPMALTLTYRQPKRIPPQKKLEAIQKKPAPIIKRPKKKKVQLKFKKKFKPISSKKKPNPEPKPEPKPPEPEKTIRSKIESEKVPLLEPELLYEDETLKMHEEEMDFASVPIKEEKLKETLQGIKDKATEPEPPPLREAIPVYQKNPHPKYPRIARRRGYQGTVMLEVFINREGKVGDLRLFQSSGYRVLDRTAMASVKNWLFEPGRRGDQKVEMWVKVPIRFRLK